MQCVQKQYDNINKNNVIILVIILKIKDRRYAVCVTPVFDLCFSGNAVC